MGLDSKGDAYVIGYTYGAFPHQVSHGGADAFLTKYNSDGKMSWSKQFGSNSDEVASGIATDQDKAYVAGDTYGTLPSQTSSGGDDAYVAKFDDKGNMIWMKQFGTSSFDHPTGISANDSGIYLTGFTSGTFPSQTNAGGEDAFLAKFDKKGNMLWVKQFGTSFDDEVYSISADSSGLYLAGFTSGTFPGQTSSGGADAFLEVR